MATENEAEFGQNKRPKWRQSKTLGHAFYL